MPLVSERLIGFHNLPQTWQGLINQRDLTCDFRDLTSPRMLLSLAILLDSTQNIKSDQLLNCQRSLYSLSY